MCPWWPAKQSTLVMKAMCEIGLHAVRQLAIIETSPWRGTGIKELGERSGGGCELP